MKSSTPKEKMLKKIRKALIEKKEMPFQKYEEGEIFPEISEGLELIFAEEFTKVAGQFIFCEDEIQFIENIISLAEQKKWKHIYCWEPSLQAILAKYDYPFAASENEFISADVGITLCEGLVARTGSILIHSSTHAGRRLSIYPNSHIVLAYTSQIFPDMKDALADLKNKYGEKLPSLYTAITGPSRTADIEKTLVLGAHGPKELFLFLIDDQI